MKYQEWNAVLIVKVLDIDRVAGRKAIAISDLRSKSIPDRLPVMSPAFEVKINIFESSRSLNRISVKSSVKNLTRSLKTRFYP